MISKERLDFEAWVVDWWPQAAGNLDRDGDDYQNHFLNYAWAGWLARSKHQETPKEPPADDGWIPWAGGEQPVGDEVVVEVRIEHPGFYAVAFDWAETSPIVAYRVIKGE